MVDPSFRPHGHASQVVILRCTGEKIRDPFISERVERKIKDEQRDSRCRCEPATKVVSDLLMPSTVLIEQRLGERLSALLGSRLNVSTSPWASSSFRSSSISTLGNRDAFRAAVAARRARTDHAQARSHTQPANGAASPPTKHRSVTSAPVSQAVVGLQVQGTFRNSGLDDYVDVPISSRRPGRA